MAFKAISLPANRVADTVNDLAPDIQWHLKSIKILYSIAPDESADITDMAQFSFELSVRASS